MEWLKDQIGFLVGIVVVFGLLAGMVILFAGGLPTIKMLPGVVVKQVRNIVK